MNQKDCLAQGQFGFRALSHESPLRPSCPIILVSTFCYFPFGSQDGRHFHHACVVMCLCSRIEHVLGAMTSMGHVEKVSSESKRMARRTRLHAWLTVLSITSSHGRRRREPWPSRTYHHVVLLKVLSQPQPLRASEAQMSFHARVHMFLLLLK